MSIPDFQSILLPLLKATASREELTSADSYKLMSEHFQLSEAEVEAPMPSGRGSSFRNRVAWAKQYLMFAQLVEPTRRGVSRVTELGREWSRKRTAPLKIRDFEEIPGFHERAHGSAGAASPNANSPAADSGERSASDSAQTALATPEERLQLAHAELRQSTIATLLDRIRRKPPAFFEHLVIQLMSKLGYGDGSKESMLHSGQTGDGGVDGRIKMDALGLDHVFLQAKRYDEGNTVSRDQVSSFAGSIAGAKGVFLTTSTFSRQAIDFIKKMHKNIVLVDGQGVGALMLQCGLGVAVKRTYESFAIDEDFFADEE
jgi:restriction system protein